MNKSMFPLNYILSIWSPKIAFNNRKQLNWLQMVLIFILLTLIMIIPVYNHYQQIDIFAISDFYPNAVELIDDETVEALQEETEYLKEDVQGIIAVGLPASELPEAETSKNFLVFGSDAFVIGDETGSVETVSYTNDFSLSQVTNQADVIHELSRQYTAQNHGSLVFSFTLVMYIFILVVSLFIVLIYAYLLKMWQDYSRSTIYTYQEAVNLILNLSGLPTLLAFLYSFYRFNLITMLGIQIIGLIIMIVILYRQTKFQDMDTDK